MENDIRISDNTTFNVEWSIFHAALRSYKSEIYLDKEINDYANKDMLEKIWNQIAYCQHKGQIPSEEVQKFHDTVMNKQKFRLSLSSNEEIDNVLKTFLITNKSSDNFDRSKMILFKVNYESFGNFDNFCRFSEKYGSFLALHGSPVNRFYSILQNGLILPKSNDEPGLYGYGIYLTNKLDVALHFAQAHLFDCGWLKDESIKIAAICEVAKHPSAVVRKEHKSSDGFSLGSGIPPEYYLVKDDCMVHVTHLLVVTSCQVSFLESRSRTETTTNVVSRLNIVDSVSAAFRRNWLLYTVAIYIGVLILVTCFNNRCVLFSDWDSSDLLSIND